MAEQQQQQHAGSVTSPPTTPLKSESEPAKSEPEERSDKKKTKTKKLIGQYEYIGQDDRRFLFQDRATKKCFTVDKSLLEYRGEGGFRVEVIESLQK